MRINLYSLASAKDILDIFFTNPSLCHSLNGMTLINYLVAIHGLDSLQRFL